MIKEPREDNTTITAHMNSSNIFTISLSPSRYQASPCIQDISLSTDLLWHHRLGHLNFHSIQTMQDKELVERMPRLSITTQNCESSAKGKTHRLPFPKTTYSRADRPLKCSYGPMGPSKYSISRRKEILPSDSR